MKILVFDMDGTIADLYGVDNWLSLIRMENPRPYEIARPLYDMDSLDEILKVFKSCGWRIVVTSWLAKDSSAEYDTKVRKAKLEWLNRYNFPYDEVHIIKYGTTKANATRRAGGFQILIDDNEKVRKGWKLGETINANENIIDALLKIIEEERV